MKKTIHQIRQQSLQVREMATWLSVAVVFSMVAVFWFMDFKNDSYAILNPDKVQEDTAVAENDGEKKASPFAAILTALGDFKNGVGNIFDSNTTEEEGLRDPITLPLSK